MFWLVAWNMYGSWLPGDPRGFRTFRAREHVPPPERFAKNGEDIYDPRDYEWRYRLAKIMVPDAVTLTESEMKLALEAFVPEIEAILNPLILAVGGQHCHLIAEFGAHKIRPTVGSFKASATRAIPNPGTRPRIWATECHMESLKGANAVENAYNYVSRHEEDGFLIYDWTYKPKEKKRKN